MCSNRQITVGLFLLGGLSLFALGLFWIGDRRLLFDEHILLQAEFFNLSGLKKGSKVLVSGLVAGEVLDIIPPPDPESKFRVRFRALEDFRAVLRSDSTALIQTDGIVGNMILRVSAGTNTGRPVADGDTIRSREPVEIGDMLQRASETLVTVEQAMDELRVQLNSSLIKIDGVATRAEEFVQVMSDDVKRFVTASSRVATEIEAIVARAGKGEGTVGKLLADDQLYKNLTSTFDNAQKMAENLRQTTEKANKIMAQLDKSGSVEDIAKTIDNIRALSDEARRILADLKPPDGNDDNGLVAELRQSVANANEATSDLAENMEAMKRNFLLKGFFKDRGFYDLDGLSLEEYTRGEFAPKRDRKRTWIHASELFTTGADGQPQLTERGKQQLDTVIAPYLAYAPDTPLIVEGYSGDGEASEQFILSRARAVVVRRYLMKKYALKSDYVGLMPMGKAVSQSGDGTWEGVAIVYFPEKAKGKAANDSRAPPARNGFRPTTGGLPTRSGFALGVAYQETDLLRGLVDVKVSGSAGYYRYLKGELSADMPRLWNENLFIETTARFRNYPRENFFGLGSDSSSDSRATYRFEDFDYTADFGFRPATGWRAGVSAGYMLVNVGPGTDANYPSIEQTFSASQAPALSLQSDYLHFGAFLGYSSLDNYYLPRSGGDYQFRWTYFDDRSFGSFSFGRYDVVLRRYFPVGEEHSVALKALASFTDTPPGQQTPFFLLPTVGGSESVRGFRQDRFRDRNALVFNAEYRHQIYPYFDFVTFGDAGRVFSQASHPALAKLEWAGGVGARLKLSGGVFFGIDVGFGREGMRTWFRGSHSF